MLRTNLSHSQVLPLVRAVTQTARNVLFNNDWSSGQINKSGNKDRLGVICMTKTPIESINIVGITKANPARIELASAPTNLRGYRVEGVGGMTELEGVLVRTKNISGNFADLYEDHVIPGFNGSPATFGAVKIDSSAFGAFTSGGVLGRYRGVDHLADDKNFDSTSNSECRIVATETVNGEVWTPLVSTHFLRTACSYTKDYALDFGQPRNKPRNVFSLPKTLPSETGQLPYDTLAYTSCSFGIPTAWENETATGGDSSKDQIWDIREDAGLSGGGFCILDIATPNGSDFGGIAFDTVPHWIMRMSFSDSSVSVVTETYWDLGPIGPDKGFWTTFNIELLINPFNSADHGASVNPVTDLGISGAIDQTYVTDRGRFRVWKAEGPEDGERKRNMILKINKFDVGVGAVPRAGFRTKMEPRRYRFPWHHHNTSVEGLIPDGSTYKEVVIYMDNFQYGENILHGTEYSDVDPFRRDIP